MLRGELDQLKGLVPGDVLFPIAVLTVDALANDTELARLAHPGLECSIATPAGWTALVRRKTFPFGKTRVDFNADKWYEPERDDDWNVMKLTDGANK